MNNVLHKIIKICFKNTQQKQTVFPFTVYLNEKFCNIRLTDNVSEKDIFYLHWFWIPFAKMELSSFLAPTMNMSPSELDVC